MTTLGLRDLGFLGASQGGSFTPASISTALWLDASDSSTITTVSGAVSQWNDKSGNGRHATQSSASLRPIFNTGTGVNQNVTSDGTDDRMTIATTPMHGQSQFAVFAVSRCTSGPDWGALLCNVDGGSSGFGCGHNMNTAYSLRQASYRVWNTTSSRNCLKTTPSNSLPMATTAQTCLIWVNGVEPSAYINGSNQAFLRWNAEADNPLTIIWASSDPGIGMFATNFAYSQTFANLSINELCVINGAITQQTRQSMEGYLAWKWGLTASLPSDHPYKNSAPK